MTDASQPPPQVGPNPLGDSFNISVHVPEEITIRMVDASALADYEVWFFLSSVLSSAFVGFLIAFSQASENKSPSAPAYFWITVLAGILFAVAFLMAILKRRNLRKKGRTMKLRTSQA